MHNVLDISSLMLYAPYVSGICAENGRARLLSRELLVALTPRTLFSIGRECSRGGC